MVSFPIDLVVTYVDDRDPVWRGEITKYNTDVSPQRFRSIDIFPFLFRGVERYMPFIRTIHLVVSNIEQVPRWIDTSRVHVVLHEEIIPPELLPTFNSTTIEMYLHRIPGLSEHFIYGNDDMFPLNPLTAGDFFTDCGQPIYELVHKSTTRNTFRMQCMNSYRLAAELTGTEIRNGEFFYIKHSMSPMLKRAFEEVHEKAGYRILKRCTKFREPWNFTQYLFPDYAVMSGLGVLGEMSFRYFTVIEVKWIIHEMHTGYTKIICINDAEGGWNRRRLVDGFLEKFPERSKYELIGWDPRCPPEKVICAGATEVDHENRS